ncbi:unnamed protein product [Sphagnum troendelagicum]|uniref:Uncharacterized protein n=1 Tax=Sphagnum troendelagicum TaxID=128251 RepID=A0ABP0UP56_9BRYO
MVFLLHSVSSESSRNRFRNAIVGDLRLESGWDGQCQCRRVAGAVNAVTPDIPSLTAILQFTGTHDCIAILLQHPTRTILNFWNQSTHLQHSRLLSN